MMTEQVVHSTDDYRSICDDLRRSGLALIHGRGGGQELVRLGRQLGEIVPHRDSGDGGVTIIEDRGAHQPGLDGFTQLALRPHTDRSSLVSPPALVITLCANESTTGGSALLVDGRAVYDEMATERASSIEVLSSARTVMFGGADGYLGSIFSRLPTGRLAIRYRDDSMVRFSPRLTPHLGPLRHAIQRNIVRLPMNAGVGYVVDNLRWLHGREAYQGQRCILRILVDPHTSTIDPGFVHQVRLDRKCSIDGQL